MSYRNEFINKIRNREYLPNFERPNFILELNNKASKAADKKDLYGYLSSVLIYHQMKEEILKALLKKAQFYAQLNNFPEEIIFSRENYSKLDYDVNGIGDKPDFINREVITKLSEELDIIKCRMVNLLTDTQGVEGIEGLAYKAREVYEEIFKAFRESNLWFYRKFRDFEETKLLSS